MFEPYWNTDYGYDHSHRQQFEYLGFETLSKHLAFIHDSQLQICQNNIKADVDLIRQCQQQTGRLPVLTLDSNPYNVALYIEQLNQFLDPHSYFVFSSDIRPTESFWTNAAPWPSWLLYQHFLPDNQQDHPKSKRIGFLSGVPRQHRINLFRKIKPLISDQDVVVINTFSSSIVNTDAEWLVDLPWTNNSEYFDTPQTASEARDQAHNHHIAYRACVNITGETLGTGNMVLPSEKTWKAYKSGCLVVNYGTQQMPDWLRSVGIEIWQDFDQSQPYQQKIALIQQLFQQQDLFEIYQKNKSMVDYNKNLVMSKPFVSKLASMAINKLICLIK